LVYGSWSNPANRIQSDILLFHRKKAQIDRQTKTKSARSSDPIVPEALEEMNIEDFIVGELDADNHLDIFDEVRMASALDEYVSKEQAQAINDSVSKLLQKQQSKLIKLGQAAHDEAQGGFQSNEPARTKTSQKDVTGDDDFKVVNTNINVGKSPADVTALCSASAMPPAAPIDVGSDSDNAAVQPLRGRRTRKAPARKRKDVEEVDFEEEIEPSARATVSRRSRASAKRMNYMEEESDDSVVEVKGNRLLQDKTASSVRAPKSIGSPPASMKSLSQSQLSFIPVKRNGRASAVKRSRAAHAMSSDDDEDPNDRISTYDMDDDWGTAKTDTLE
jgi:hypothetical protein